MQKLVLSNGVGETDWCKHFIRLVVFPCGAGNSAATKLLLFRVYVLVWDKIIQL